MVSKLECNDRVSVAKSVCKNLEADERVNKMIDQCIVDDWNPDCNSFSMFIELPMKDTRGYRDGLFPKNKKYFSLRSLTYGIKRAVKKSTKESDKTVFLNWIEHPERTYSKFRIGGSSFEGYDKSHTQFDINVI